MHTYAQLVETLRQEIEEIFPWQLSDILAQHPDAILLDVREADEFRAARLPQSINVPRGVLEAACEFGFAETEPMLARARDKLVVVVCRSGNRSVLAAHTLKLLGYQHVMSLKTGVKGCNDCDLPLMGARDETLDGDDADAILSPELRAEQRMVGAG